MTRAALPTLLDRLDQRLAADTGAPVVICVGHSAWDLSWTLPTLPQGGGKLRATAYAAGGGGMAATAAVAVARLGGRAQFWGRAGDDAAGHAMRGELVAMGVEVRGLRLVPGARSSVSGVLVDAAGERFIANFRGEGLPDDPSWLPLPDIASAGAVLADMRWRDGAHAALQAARAAGRPTVLDGDVGEPADFAMLLPHVDVAVFSEPGLAACSGTADPATGLRHALQMGCRLAAVTRGAHGVTWTDGGALHTLPAHTVAVVDTTGAGDAFHGACALALACGLSVDDAFVVANAVAALKCMRAGGRAGLPDAAALRAFLTEPPDASTPRS